METRIQNGSDSGTKISDEESDYLKDIYYSPRSPVAFSSFQKIYKFIKQEGKNIKPKKLKVWLSKQEAYTSHYPARRKFQRPRVLAFSKNYQWDTDTANMNQYKKYNDGYGYFVVFIDIFTRFLYTAPLKTLTGKEMVYILNHLINTIDEQPKKLRSDQGSEYLNRDMRKFVTDKGIDHIFTFYETKANFAERVIKTIKLKIVKYFTNKETYRWMEILRDLIYSYNQSYHRSIKMSPSDAQDVDSFILWKRQYAIDLNKPSSSTKNYKNKTKKNSSRKLYTKRYKFKLGDKVKISYIKKKFDREYSERWSGEIFTIVERKMNQKVPMYKLKDYNNEVIESYFYEPELQMAYIDSDVIYKIEKILQKRKRNRISEVLVKWKGWPDKFNSWIPESDLQDIN